MAADRNLLPQLGTDGKVAALSDLEFRVWVQYILSADDYGVMLASAKLLQGQNAALDNRPSKRVQTALETIIGLGLVKTFEVEGIRYIWSSKWQDWQGIRHPRRTSLPCPPDLSAASGRTRELFAQHSSQISEELPKSNGDNSASRASARPHGRETLTQTHTQTETQTQPDAEKAPTRELLALFDSEHQKRFGSKAAIQGAKDAALLADLWKKRRGDPVDAEAIIRRFFQSRDPFVVTAGFTVGVMVSQVGKLLIAKTNGAAPRADWRDECERLHHGRCGNATFHAAKVDEDADRAPV